MKVGTVLWQGSLSQRVVNVWNDLHGKVVASERMDKCKWDLYRNLDALEVEGYGDVCQTCT